MAAGLKGGCDLDCGSYYQNNGQVCLSVFFLSVI